MVYIKKLVMKGFKSFAKETAVDLSNGMNVIVGPNGSGKSNITDAICFVLGRMSAKSMRAAKSSNMIFAGTKMYKPASEAHVKITFDNIDKKFPLESNEVSVDRIVRTNGQGIYKINNEVKTRQEVLELLSQAGIDAYGFNLVLQGEIVNIVRTNAEERRKVIEEVAGISIYETRKEKSLRELEKTEEKLKEVQATLRERTSYLKTLEEERKQALKYKQFEEQVARCKASILKKKIDEKDKELLKLNEETIEKEKEKQKTKEKEDEIHKKNEELQKEVDIINQYIQKSSGIEQDKLNREIADFRANLAGSNVKKENLKNKLDEILSRRNKITEEIKKLEIDIKELGKESPEQAKKHDEINKKKIELAEIEKEKKIYYNFKEKLNFTKEKIIEKEKTLQKNKDSYEFLMKEIEKSQKNLDYADVNKYLSLLQELKEKREKDKKELENLELERRKSDAILSVNQSEINNLEKIKKQVAEIDICPLCKSKITSEHIHDVSGECDEKIANFKKELEEKKIFVKTASETIEKLKSDINTINNNIYKYEIDRIKLENINERTEQLKKLILEEKQINLEIQELSKTRDETLKKTSDFQDIEERYDKLFLEIQEISARTNQNINAEIEYKQKSLENSRIIIKQSYRDEEQYTQELKEIEDLIKKIQKNLADKEQESKVLEAKFQKSIEKKNLFDRNISRNNSIIYEFKAQISNIENNLNNIKVDLARISAEKQTMEADFQAFKDIPLLQLPIFTLEEKLSSAKAQLQILGNVNMRALEVYDKMKIEYDQISEKVTTLENEKIEIMKIIEEIDKKKKKSFVKTLEALNELFNRNFTQLSTKGQVSLEVENPEDIFAGGVDIVVKVGKGKYFDVTSLSGGEQTLVALSLIFAIQEYKPYSFYIFDEIDAALDKRNSERLAALVKKYINAGQYIIVTHNDALITESSVLYGVSMQEGVSKILSLQI